MRRAIAGGVTLIASIAVPATFHGTVFLAALWLLIALAGIALILTSEPVKQPLLAALRRELNAVGGEVATTPPPDRAANLRLAIAELAEELEAARHVLTSHDAGEFFMRHQLAVVKWEQHGAKIVGDADLHKTVRAAYRAIDAVNNRGITRGLVAGNRRTTMVDPTRSNEALEAIGKALSALEKQTAA